MKTTFSVDSHTYLWVLSILEIFKSQIILMYYTNMFHNI